MTLRELSPAYREAAELLAGRIRQLQQQAFLAQLELAKELDLPAIVHEREAHEDGMAIISSFPTVTGVFHCYSGSAEMSRQLVELCWKGIQDLQAIQKDILGL